MLHGITGQSQQDKQTAVRFQLLADRSALRTENRGSHTMEGPLIKKFRANQILHAFTVLLAMLIISGCSYQDWMTSTSLPDSTNSAVLENGLKISARVFTDPNETKKSFGFDTQKAGLLPVRITFQNNSTEKALINPDQTLLIDRNNRAWPILSLEGTYGRLRRQMADVKTATGRVQPALLRDATEDIAGLLAVGIVDGGASEVGGKGVVTIAPAAGAVIGSAQKYSEVGGKIRDDLYNMNLKNQAILPNQKAYGYLFFPAKPEGEAEGAIALRLSIAVGESRQIVTLNLTGQ